MITLLILTGRESRGIFEKCLLYSIQISYQVFFFFTWTTHTCDVLKARKCWSVWRPHLLLRWCDVTWLLNRPSAGTIQRRSRKIRCVLPMLPECCSVTVIKVLYMRYIPEKSLRGKCQVPMYGLQLHSCCVHADQVRGCSGCVYRLLGFFWISLATTVLCYWGVQVGDHTMI